MDTGIRVRTSGAGGWQKFGIEIVDNQAVFHKSQLGYPQNQTTSHWLHLQTMRHICLICYYADYKINLADNKK